jgi:hypothetical protein
VAGWNVKEKRAERVERFAALDRIVLEHSFKQVEEHSVLGRAVPSFVSASTTRSTGINA